MTDHHMGPIVSCPVASRRAEACDTPRADESFARRNTADLGVPGGDVRKITLYEGGDRYEAVTASRSPIRWLISVVTPSPRMVTP